MERQAQFDKHEGATGQMDTGYFDDTRNSVSLRSNDHVRPTVPKETRQPENMGEVSNLFSNNIRDKHDHRNENSLDAVIL
eukprot:3746681-Ditylum_brightwellii.AAC.1